MKRWGCGCAAIFGLPFLFLLGITGALAFLEVPLLLVFGWVPSAARLAQAWHPNLGHVLLFLLALAILITGAHRFLRWVYSAAHPQTRESRPGPWPWKWTLCGTGIGLCSLIAITSVVLTMHQVYWLSLSTDPWFEDRIRRIALLPGTAWNLWTEAETNHWDSARTQTAFWSKLNYDGSTAELLQPVWVEADESKLRAILLLPRGTLTKKITRFALLQPGTNAAFLPLDKLPTTLAAFGINSVSPETNSSPSLLP